MEAMDQICKTFFFVKKLCNFTFFFLKSTSEVPLEVINSSELFPSLYNLFSCSHAAIEDFINYDNCHDFSLVVVRTSGPKRFQALCFRIESFLKAIRDI